MKASLLLAAGAVALGILGLALGGLAIVPVDKDQFRGRTIDDASDRSNLRNPVATDFVPALQAAIDAGDTVTGATVHWTAVLVGVVLAPAMSH